MKKLILGFLAIVCLFSCSDNVSKEMTPEQKTAESFKTPVTVGVLPDGRVVQYVVIHSKIRAERVYIIGNSTTYESQNGKFSTTVSALQTTK